MIMVLPHWKSFQVALLLEYHHLLILLLVFVKSNHLLLFGVFCKRGPDGSKTLSPQPEYCKTQTHLL